MREHAVARQVVAVAEDAVPIVDLAPVLDMFAELFRIRSFELSEGVVSGIDLDLVVVDRDLGRRCRMDRAREERRLEGDVHLDVDVRGGERRDGDGHCAEERCVPLVGHEPDERAGDLVTAFLAGRQVRQDRDRDDSHVDRDDGGGNRGGESESEQDVEPRPPGDGPQQQIGPTEAKEPERGDDSQDDRDVHRVTFPRVGRQAALRRGAWPEAHLVRPWRLGRRAALAAGWLPGPAAPGAVPAGRGASRRRRARGGRRGVVAVTRLQRDRRRAAKGLEVRDHAEDLLIGKANRRPVDGGHPRIESRHDEGVRFVQRLGEVVERAQARDALRRATGDSREVGEPERSGLADRVAGPAQALTLRDLAADLDHLWRGEVGSDRRSPREAELRSEAPSGRRSHRTRSSRGRERRFGGRAESS